jgi:putative endonuclease
MTLSKGSQSIISREVIIQVLAVSIMYIIFYTTNHISTKDAIAREKEIKGLTREKKMKLINEMNPRLEFLNKEICGSWPPRELPGRY